MYDRIESIDMESWTEELKEKLIELWQQNECLCDIRCKTYSDSLKIDLQLRKLQRKLTLPVRTSQYGCLSIRRLVYFKL